MSDISLRFEIQTSQRQVMLKLEFECRTEEGAGGNSGFDRKWILTNLELPQSCAALSCQISRQSANVRLSYWRFSTLPRCNLRGGAFLSNAGGSNSRHVENDAKFSTFWPPCEIYMGGVGDSFTYDRFSGIHLTDIHCAAAERGVLIY